MHKKFGKDARVVPEISSRTERHTQTYSSQYFAITSMCEVKNTHIKMIYALANARMGDHTKYCSEVSNIFLHILYVAP